jgi:hypothetical protein
MVASSTTPVRPMPPKVAQNSDGRSLRLVCTSSPLASSIRMLCTQALKQPCTWWAFPCTSLAMAPPTVTYLVPGVIIGKKPRGAKSSMMAARLAPASTVSTPLTGSKPR